MRLGGALFVSRHEAIPGGRRGRRGRGCTRSLTAVCRRRRGWLGCSPGWSRRGRGGRGREARSADVAPRLAVRESAVWRRGCDREAWLPQSRGEDALGDAHRRGNLSEDRGNLVEAAATTRGNGGRAPSGVRQRRQGSAASAAIGGGNCGRCPRKVRQGAAATSITPQLSPKRCGWEPNFRDAVAELGGRRCSR